MRSVVLITICIVLLTATPIRAQAGSLTHIVQPGENLFRIALRYGLTTNEVAAANGISDPTRIFVGQTLVIPIAASSAPAVSVASTVDNPAAVHIVQPGENLFRIGLRYGVTPQQIASMNGLGGTTTIFVGQRLSIPPASGNSAAPAFVATDGKRLAVTLYGQQHTLSCEAAAARMLADYYGVSQSEWWFINAFGLSDNPHIGFRGDVDGQFGWIDNYGTYAEPVARALLGAGIDANVRYGMSYDDLRAALDAGSAVIVWTTPRSDVYDQPAGYRLVPEEHTYVVTGYDSSGFYINDPLFGGRRLKLRSIPGWELFSHMAVIGPAVASAQ